jgi:hypothetical protein
LELPPKRLNKKPITDKDDADTNATGVVAGGKAAYLYQWFLYQLLPC